MREHCFDASNRTIVFQQTRDLCRLGHACIATMYREQFRERDVLLAQHSFALCKRVDSKLCLLSLVKYVREVSTETEMNAAVLKMTFRLMMILIPRVSKLDLETWASGTLIGAAHRALNHSSSGMSFCLSLSLRMAAVLLIVEMSTRLDETFLKSVEATVSPIQMKLIQVYIEKRQQKKVSVVRSTKKTPSTTPRRGVCI